MSDTNLNHPAIRALFEVNGQIADLVNWVEHAPYLMPDEVQAADVGAQILGRLYKTRTLALNHARELALAAGIPSAQVIAALDRSLDGAFDQPKDC